MSKGNVDKFLELMQKDEGLARKMAACLYMLENGGGKAEGSGGFIAREIVPLAKEYGFEFTEQDFLDYTNEATAKAGLTAEDLAEVSGGKGGVRAALMGTLALLGVAAAPAAMDMLSGGEVSQFSMVASAETPKEEKSEQATPEQLEELQLGIAALKSLKGTIQSSKLTQDEKDALEKSRDNILKTAEAALQSKDKAAVEKEENKIKDYLKEIKRNSLTNNWFTARNKFLGLSARLKKLEGKTFLNQQEIAKLRNIANTLKKNLIELKKEQGKGKKATRTNADDFEATIKSFEDILARAEELNKEKDELVKKLDVAKKGLSYEVGQKIDAQIAALNDEIKDFTPENIAKKEADFETIKASTNAIIEVNDLQKEVDDLLETKGANQNILNDIKGALDIAARDLTKENAADISKVLTEIKEKLKAEKENIKKIKSESKEKKEQQKKKQKENEKKAAEDHTVAEIARFYETTKVNAENTLPTLKNRLDGLENFVMNVQKRTDAAAVQEAIDKLRERIENFGNVTYENAKDKATELESIQQEVNALVDAAYGFEGSLSTLLKKPKASIKEMLALYKNDAIKAKDEAAVAEIEKLEQELAAISEQPTDALELSRVATRIGNIKVSIPQIKAMLNKATTLKNIAEKVDANFAKVFDNIIKEIEAADSVDKINLAEETLQNAEITLRGLMRKKINEANKTAHILHEIAKIFGLNQFKGIFLNLIDTFDRFNYGAAPITELYNVYQTVETVSAAEKDLTEWLGEQIAALKEQATKLKDRATGVDVTLANIFDDCLAGLALININNNLEEITDDFNFIQYTVGDFACNLAWELSPLEEVRTLLTIDSMGAEIQEELQALEKYIEEKLTYMAVGVDPDTCEEKDFYRYCCNSPDELLDVFDKLTAVKTKVANKLLEWHKILSEYHNAEEGIENIEDAIAFKLASMKATVEKMIAGTDGIKLDAETLNATVDLAIEIADNLNTDIVGIMNNIKSYNGFGEFDFTAGTQANTLVTFLRYEVGDVHALKFVDKKTRAKLATDIKHIFDQIKIDQKTGKYYLPGFYNQLGAVNHEDLKLICEAYDVVADDFGERVVYRSPKEGKGLTFKDQADVLVQALSQVQRLDLFDVSPESREALKNDILEIGAKIKSEPGRIYGHTLSLEGVDQKETKNMQSGLEEILEFYNSIQAQMKTQK